MSITVAKRGSFCKNAFYFMKKRLSFLLIALMFISALFGGASIAQTQNSAPAEAKNAPEKSASKVAAVPLQTSPKMRSETRWLVMCMEKGHYLKQSLSDLDVREFIRVYMSNLDFLKLFFLSEDVQYFQDFFAPSIDIMLRQGTLLPAYSIYEKFIDRADARLKWIKKRMAEPIDLKGKDEFSPDRSKADWPSSEAEADKLWLARIKYDIINQMLGYTSKSHETDMINEAADEESKIPQEKPLAEDKVPQTYEEKFEKAKAEVLKRYERMIANINTSDAMEIQEIYLNSLANMYDPHSTFLSEYFLEEFDISVRNALVGIGALLQDKDGYCTIAELIAGGPAEESKLLHPGDKILSVGQETGEMVDAVGMKLRKVVKMIRGTEGSKVRLLIEPSNNPSGRKTITLIRKEIQLTTKLAKAAIYTVPVGDKTLPVGVIDLPAFYGESAEEGGKGFSTSKDVEELIGKLKARGVKGIILDLRRNGGGFLNEAVDLAGLFIKTGPVLQVRDVAGKIRQLSDENDKIVWDRPLLILVSRLSASAAEIVAGALQNHKRAIIVGDKATHGKGTVQAVYHLSNFDPQLKSAAKVTIQKWYLPNGDSIQMRGIASDIVLPSLFDYMEVGEENKDYALKWDSIPTLGMEYLGEYGFPNGEGDALLKTLSEKSSERLGKLAEFKYLKGRLDWFKTKQDKKSWSLNYDERAAEMKADDDLADKAKERQKELAKQNYAKEDILLDSAKENDKKQKALDEEKKALDSKNAKDGDSDEDDDVPDFDIQLREALRIMADWIGLIDERKSAAK